MKKILEKHSEKKEVVLAYFQNYEYLKEHPEYKYERFLYEKKLESLLRVLRDSEEKMGSSY